MCAGAETTAAAKGAVSARPIMAARGGIAKPSHSGPFAGPFVLFVPSANAIRSRFSTAIFHIDGASLTSSHAIE